jgi:PhzF family phenazine biosynthesis protein
MSTKIKFTTLDVFTSVPYYGNPLAIVHVPVNITLTSAQKQLIAREFNFSETVFLHEPLNENETVVTIDIFATTAELPFAGHPTVGTGWYLLPKSPPTLLTKADQGYPRIDHRKRRGSSPSRLQSSHELLPSGSEAESIPSTE